MPQAESTTAQSYCFSDFTEDGYRELLVLAQSRYAFGLFNNPPDQPHVLWRHDIDLSVHRALKMAEVEADIGVQATYFVLLHSEFYNLLDKSVFEKMQAILALGHALGLHFDMAFYPPFKTVAQLEAKLAWEKAILEDLFAMPVFAFSYHNPGSSPGIQPDTDTVAGMVNTYGKSIQQHYRYCSDSNGYWRHQRLHNVLSSTESGQNLHILTHPEWWVPNPMSPRERVTRCIEGRSAYLHQYYDDLLVRHGRENIGPSHPESTR